jgi:hypothetical protein
MREGKLRGLPDWRILAGRDAVDTHRTGDLQPSRREAALPRAPTVSQTAAKYIHLLAKFRVLRADGGIATAIVL